MRASTRSVDHVALAPRDALVGPLERLDTASLLAELGGLGEELGSEEVVAALWSAWLHIDGRAGAGEIDAGIPGAAAAVARRLLPSGPGGSAHPGVGATGEMGAPAGPLVVVSPPGNADLLAADVLAAVAGGRGWAVGAFTNSSGVDELSAFVACHRPSALALVSVDTAALPALAAVAALAHPAGVPVIAWGPAFGGGDLRARAIGADGYAPDLEAVFASLGDWRAEAPRPSQAPALPEAYADLRRLRPQLLAAAAAALGEQANREWLLRRAELLVEHLTASVAVSDPSVLATFIGREQRGSGCAGGGELALLGLVDAVASALPLTSVVAREYIYSCREDLRRSLGAASRALRRAPGTDGGPFGAGRGDPLAGARRQVAETPARPTHPGVTQPPGQGAAAASSGQAFADLLFLASMAAQVPVTLLSVPQPGGAWSTLSYGLDQRDGLSDPRLFDYVAAQAEPVEVTDLATHSVLAACPIAKPPHVMRWVYAVALRTEAGSLLGVLAVLDRWVRELSRREQRVLQASARQATSHLLRLRRPSAPAEAAAPGSGADPDAGTDPLASLRRFAALSEGQQLLRSHEVAVLFDVTERTVINWAASGKLPSLRTIGGHLRFRSDDVLELLAGRNGGGTRNGLPEPA